MSRIPILQHAFAQRGMPICIECRYPVPQLYHVSQSNGPKVPADTSTKLNKSSNANASTTKLNDLSKGAPPGGEASRKGIGGRDVRLTQCPRCKRFADKYVEHDYVVLFIDLMLVKPQVQHPLLIRQFSSTLHYQTDSLRAFRFTAISSLIVLREQTTSTIRPSPASEPSYSSSKST